MFVYAKLISFRTIFSIETDVKANYISRDSLNYRSVQEILKVMNNTFKIGHSGYSIELKIREILSHRFTAGTFYFTVLMHSIVLSLCNEHVFYNTKQDYYYLYNITKCVLLFYVLHKIIINFTLQLFTQMIKIHHNFN